jgi:Tol biopolymer transport system component
MSLTGGDRRLVTTNGTQPKVSPDGKWITYVSFDTRHHYPALFAVRFDGSQRHQVTPYARDIGGHDWSPDGKLIVLTTNADHARPDEPVNLVTIRPDGSGMTPLTHFTDSTTSAFAGSFSPDGKQIVFRLNKRRRYALAVIDSDGRNLRLLTSLTASAWGSHSRFADWGTHH